MLRTKVALVGAIAAIFLFFGINRVWSEIYLFLLFFCSSVMAVSWSYKVSLVVSVEGTT